MTLYTHKHHKPVPDPCCKYNEFTTRDMGLKDLLKHMEDNRRCEFCQHRHRVEKYHFYAQLRAKRCEEYLKRRL